MLVGTQMVAKGHHFAGVALAAVVDADTGLGLPDFRAEERTFQLLTQLAGRSGRDAPGRVLVQTFQPDARAISSPRGTTSRDSSPRRANGAGSSAIRRFATSCASSPRGRESGGPERVLAELKPGWATTPRARRRCFACVAGTAPSSSRRPSGRADRRERGRAALGRRGARCARPA